VAPVDIRNYPCVPTRTVWNPYNATAKKVLERWGFVFLDKHPDDNRLRRVLLPKGNWSIIQYHGQPDDVYFIWGPQMENRAVIWYSNTKCRMKLMSYFDINIEGDAERGYTVVIRRNEFPIKCFDGRSHFRYQDTRPPSQRALKSELRRCAENWLRSNRPRWNRIDWPLA